jgi:hypothetical protein
MNLIICHALRAGFTIEEIFNPSAPFAIHSREKRVHSAG